MLGRRRREGNHGFLSCSRLLNCLPKLNDCKTNTSICYRLGFVIYKQCLLEAVTVYNLIAVMYFLEKEGIHQKQVMVRLCTKIWTRSNGRKEPPLPSEKQSLIYKVEGLLISLGKAQRLASGWNSQNHLHVMLSTLQLLAFLKNWPSYWGFVHFFCGLYHIISLKNGKKKKE